MKTNQVTVPSMILALAKKGHLVEAQKLADIYTPDDSMDHDIGKVHSLLDSKDIRYKMEPAKDDAVKLTLYGDHDKNELDLLGQSFKHVGFICKGVDYKGGLHHMYLVHSSGQYEELNP